jgi:hypothetical protein
MLVVSIVPATAVLSIELALKVAVLDVTDPGCTNVEAVIPKLLLVFSSVDVVTGGICANIEDEWTICGNCDASYSDGAAECS